MSQTVELTREGEVRGPPPDPMIGRRLLHYRVVEVIGQGGMSVVYRGRDEHLARDVAIKVLHPFLAEKPECRTRLAREARAVARLEHPNILQVFDFSGDRPTMNNRPGADNDDASAFPQEGFIIAELVRGPTLKRFGEKHSLWRVPEIGALVVWQVLQALQHAHDNGIVHRDLKPENIMVRDDGTLKLMDFGIAHVADQSGLTVTGTLLGSPAHMAPESIDGLPADVRSDVFSMGTVLYWLATGSLPFEALTPHALLKQIAEGRAVPPQQRSPRVSDDLARVIGRAMQTKPADRYQTAAEFQDALADVLKKASLEPDSDSLRAILAAADARADTVRAQVRDTFLARAQKHLDDGQTARALGCLNRVLADDASAAAARSMLDRLQAEDDDEPTATTTDDALVAVTQAPAELTDPSRRIARPSSMRWQSLLVALLAVAMIGAAVIVSLAVDDVTVADDPIVVAEPHHDDHAVSTGTPAALDDVRDLVEPAEAIKKKKLRDVLGKNAVEQPRLAPPPPVVTPTTPTEEPAGPLRRVAFRVKPWADIIVDGKLVASGAVTHEVDLAVGPHIVVFKNPRAKEHEVRFTVTREGPLPDIAARLEPRPAMLVVHANIADAFVDVGGVGKAVADTASRPLVVTLDEQSKAEREVFIYKKGHHAYRQRHTFTAGETLELNVVLEPDAGDQKPPDP